MSFTIKCPNCSMDLSASEADVGKQGKCSRCGTVFTVDMPRAAVSAMAPPPIQYAGYTGTPMWSDVTPGVIRLGDGLSRTFTLLHSNLGTFVLITLCLIGISWAIGIITIVPCIGAFLSLASFFVVQPVLTCGFYRACLKQHDGAQAEVADLFGEFSLWIDCLLLVLVESVIIILALVPGGLIILMSFIPIIFQGKEQPNVPVLVAGAIILFICLIGAGLAFLFALPALVDRRKGFWDAIQTSWGLMTSNPIGSLGAALLAFLFSLAGTLACCVGVIYAMPAIQCLFASIYRTAMPPRAWLQPPSPAAWPIQPAGPASVLPGPPAPPSVGV